MYNVFTGEMQRQPTYNKHKYRWLTMCACAYTSHSVLSTGDVSVYLIGWHPGTAPCVSPGDVSAFHGQTAGSESYLQWREMAEVEVNGGNAALSTSTSQSSNPLSRKLNKILETRLDNDKVRAQDRADHRWGRGKGYCLYISRSAGACCNF